MSETKNKVTGKVYFQSKEKSKEFMEELNKFLVLSEKILHEADPSILTPIEKIVELSVNFNMVTTNSSSINENNTLINHIKVFAQTAKEIFNEWFINFCK